MVTDTVLVSSIARAENFGCPASGLKFPAGERAAGMQRGGEVRSRKKSKDAGAVGGLIARLKRRDSSRIKG